MTKIRKKIEKEAQKRTIMLATGVFCTILIFEISITIETKVKIDPITVLTIFLIPTIPAVITYLRYIGIFFNEEKHRWWTRYVKHKIEKKEFVEVEQEKTDESFLSDIVDLVAVPSQENDKVIVAMAHNEDIINFQELPIDTFEENYNVIEKEEE